MLMMRCINFILADTPIHEHDHYCIDSSAWAYFRPTNSTFTGLAHNYVIVLAAKVQIYITQTDN